MRKLPVLLLLLVFLTLSGCTEKGFESSEVIKDFPIPAGATPVDSVAENPNISAFQKYRYSNDNAPAWMSEEYAAAIESAGWSELKEEQVGATRFFTDGERKVAFEARPDSISLYEYVD